MNRAPPSVSLAEATVLLTDGTHYTPPDVGAGIPFLTVKDVSDRGLDFIHSAKISDQEFTRARAQNSAPEVGDVLFSKDGTVGKVHLVTETQRFAVLSSLAILRPGKHLHSGYLAQFLRTPAALRAAERRKTGSAIRRIVLRDLAALTIPLPPLDEQRRIAAILDKADALRQKRKRAIALLDSLTQSIFLEMFGNPVSNPFGWQIGTLGDAVSRASDGPHVSPEYVDHGIPFLSTRHVTRRGVLWQDLKFISEADAEVHWKKAKPERGDLLYTKGGTTGIAAVVDFDRPFAVWVHVALLKTNLEVVDPTWLETMLNSDFCYRQSQVFTHGIANRDLGLKRMVKTRMYLPPIERQQEFARAVQRLKQLGSEADRQLVEAESLFASLQHRAFSGQL